MLHLNEFGKGIWRRIFNVYIAQLTANGTTKAPPYQLWIKLTRQILYNATVLSVQQSTDIKSDKLTENQISSLHKQKKLLWMLGAHFPFYIIYFKSGLFFKNEKRKISQRNDLVLIRREFNSVSFLSFGWKSVNYTEIICKQTKTPMNLFCLQRCRHCCCCCCCISQE